MSPQRKMQSYLIDFYCHLLHHSLSMFRQQFMKPERWTNVVIMLAFRYLSISTNLHGLAKGTAGGRACGCSSDFVYSDTFKMAPIPAGSDEYHFRFTSTNLRRLAGVTYLKIPTISQLCCRALKSFYIFINIHLCLINLIFHLHEVVSCLRDP